MKKSLITNKFGISLFPPPANSVLLDQEKSQNKVIFQRIDFFENKISDLKVDYEKALVDQKVALENAVILEKELKTVKSKTTVSVKMEPTDDEDMILKTGMKEEIFQLKEEKENLECCLSENVEQMSDLDSSNKRLEAANITLNRELVDARTKSSSTKSDHIKALKIEIKQWRKELGDERKQKIKLETALSGLEAKINESKELKNAAVVEENPVSAVTETSLSNETVEESVECSICAEVINDFVPTYFSGVEINPACDECKGPAEETENILEENYNNATTNLDAAENDNERKNAEAIEKTRRKIRPKVKAKLEIKIKNGEISEDAANDLEEELVKELEAELEEDLEEELGRRAKIT